jgi:hypothetical protein
MAPETYYFFFSIIAAFGPGVYLANMAYYRVKKKNLIGRKFKSGTIDYELMQKHSRNRSLGILSVVTVLGIANLIFDIYRLLHLADQGYARFILIFAPAFVVVIIIAVVVKLRGQFGHGGYDKGPHKHDKDKNDS